MAQNLAQSDTRHSLPLAGPSENVSQNPKKLWDDVLVMVGIAYGVSFNHTLTLQIIYGILIMILELGWSSIVTLSLSLACV